jgi:hypothetical protein
MTASDYYYSHQQRHARLVEAQRQGVGLMLGDDGHWHADALPEGLERAQVELAVNAELALTHHACEMGGKYVDPTNPVYQRVFSCPLCGIATSANASGKVMPHTVRVNPDA